MRTAIFDLESSSLYANTGILLCGVVKEYDSTFKKPCKVFRADEYPTWDNNKSNYRQMTEDILEYLVGENGFDIIVAHNGQYFDKTFLNSAALKYHLKYSLRGSKFIDPVMIARRHLRLARNSLSSLIDYLDIPEQKTNLRFEHWIKASHDSNKESMEYIVQHCVKDVKSLERVYDYVRKLVKKIDDGGSAY